MNWEQSWNILGTHWERTSHQLSDIAIPNAIRVFLDSAHNPMLVGIMQCGSCQFVSTGVLRKKTLRRYAASFLSPYS
jgi:hypothetical protein